MNLRSPSFLLFANNMISSYLLFILYIFKPSRKLRSGSYNGNARYIQVRHSCIDLIWFIQRLQNSSNIMLLFVVWIENFNSQEFVPSFENSEDPDQLSWILMLASHEAS